MHNTTPVFSLRTSSPAANSQCVKDIHNKTFSSLAATLNCKVGQLSEKEILARIHLPTGPGLGFVDLRKVAEPAYCAAWLQAVHRLSQYIDHRGILCASCFKVRKPILRGENLLDDIIASIPFGD